MWLIALTGCDFGAAADPSASNVVVFEVPDGSTAGGIGPSLVAEGLVDDATNWKLWLKQSGEGSCLKAGRFELSASMTKPELMETMCGVPLADEVPYTVVEGWRMRDIDADLVEKGWIEPGAYIAAASDPSRFTVPIEVNGLINLEGMLSPETFMVPEHDFKVDAFIQRQLDLFGERFDTSKAGERTPYDVLIVASMLEREEPTPAQRPIVAGIIWKRLDNGWQLGIDATSHYNLADWNDRKGLLKNLKDPNDLYNTRMHKGLPPTPIGSPSAASLDAAMSPVESEFWYYLHDSKGVLHPARNAAQHEANRKKYNVY
jgi:UPF0755 protein